MNFHAKGRNDAIKGLADLVPKALEVLEAELTSETPAPNRMETAKYILGFFVSKDAGQTYAPPAPEPMTPGELAQWALHQFSSGAMALEHFAAYVNALKESLSVEERALMIGAVQDFVALQRAANAPLINSDEAIMAEVMR